MDLDHQKKLESANLTPPDGSTERLLDKIENYGHLQEVAVTNISRFADYFKKIGAVPLNFDLEEWVRKPFVALTEKRKEGVYDKDEFRALPDYRSVVYRLVLADIIRPNLRSNWQIDRPEKGIQDVGDFSAEGKGAEIKTVDEALGIRSLTELQKSIADFVGGGIKGNVYINLHLGPGNCSLVEHLKTEAAVESGTDEHGFTDQKEISIGDKLYFNIKDVLWCHIRPEYKKDTPEQKKRQQKKTLESFIDVLAIALRKKLLEFYYKGDPTAPGQIKRRLPFFDLNQIYCFLADPKALLSDWYKDDGARFLDSAEFEFDQERQVGAEIHRLFLMLRGIDPNHANKLSMEHALREYDQLDVEKDEGLKVLGEWDDFVEILGYGMYGVNRTDLKKLVDFDDNNAGTFATLLRQACIDFIAKCRQVLHPDDGYELGELVQLENHLSARRDCTLSEIVRCIEILVKHSREFKTEWAEFLGAVGTSISKIRRMVMDDKAHLGAAKAEASRSMSANIDGLLPTQEYVSRFFSEIFTGKFKNTLDTINKAVVLDGFYEACYDWKQEDAEDNPIMLDLNRDPSVYLNNYMPGLFDKLDQMVPTGSVHQIIDTRAVSHVPGSRTKDKAESPYADVVNKAMTRLAPGGLWTTDSNRESHSRIQRIDEIKEQIAKYDGEFKAWIVVKSDTLEPISVFIQRRHPAKGFFNDQELSAHFCAGLELVDIDFASSLPVVKVLNRVRKKVMDAYDGDMTALKGRHDDILKRVEDTLYKYAIDFAAKKNKRIFDTTPEIVERTLHLRDRIREVLGANMNDKFEYVDIRQFVLAAIARSADLVLTKQQIDEIATNISQDVLNLDGHIDLPVFAHADTESTVSTIRRTKFDNSRYNQPTSIEIKPQHSNSLLYGTSAEKLWKERYRALGSLISRFGSRNKQPILLLDFKECSTNTELYKSLVKLAGNPDLIDVASVSYSDAGGTVLKHDNVVLQKLRRMQVKGGVIVGGGSLYDPYDQYGLAYMQAVGDPLYEILNDPNASVRYLGICFSAEAMADKIGYERCDGLVETFPGMLEFAPTPITVRERAHPIFRDMPSSMTLPMTHSCHIYDDRIGSTEYDSTLGAIKPLATSDLTGNHAIWEAMNGRAILIQPHPEVNMCLKDGTDPIEALIQQLTPYRAALEAQFGVRVLERVRANFDNRKEIKADAGLPLLANTLTMMFEALQKTA